MSGDWRRVLQQPRPTSCHARSRYRQGGLRTVSNNNNNNSNSNNNANDNQYTCD